MGAVRRRSARTGLTEHDYIECRHATESWADFRRVPTRRSGEPDQGADPRARNRSDELHAVLRPTGRECCSRAPPTGRCRNDDEVDTPRRASQDRLRPHRRIGRSRRAAGSEATDRRPRRGRCVGHGRRVRVLRLLGGVRAARRKRRGDGHAHHRGRVRPADEHPRLHLREAERRQRPRGHPGAIGRSAWSCSARAESSR